MIRSAIKMALSRFVEQRRAAIAVETLIIVSALMLMMTAFHAFWQVNQTNNALQKATFTGADMIAREMVPVTDAYLNGVGKMIDYMARAPGKTTLRVSSIIRISGAPESIDGLSVLWSYSPGNKHRALTTGTLAQVADSLPLMAVGYNLVLVEVSMPFDSPANIGLGLTTLRSTVPIAPRFVPILCKVGSSCALGSS